MRRERDRIVERVRSTALELVDRHNLPGMAIGLASREGTVHAEALGLADIEAAVPQGPRSRHRIASVTKTMIALCAMALVDEGALAVEARVLDLLPDIELRGPSASLNVGHLMAHTGGIGEAPTMANLLDAWTLLFRDEPDTAPIAHAYADGIVVEMPPGAKWAYANHGYGLLGEIVSRAEERPIQEVLQRRVFGPLGMADTDCDDRPHADLTTGYHYPLGYDALDVVELLGQYPPDEESVDGHNVRGRFQYVHPRAAGAVQSTIGDMCKYATALLRKGAGIVRPSTFDRMVDGHWCPDERLVSWGLGFMRGPRFGHASFGHPGTILGGWRTQLTVFPDADQAVVVHLNHESDHRFRHIDGEIVRAALDASDQTRDERPTDPGILDAAPGVYEPKPGHLTNFRTVREHGRVQVTARGHELYLRSRRGIWREGARMVPADPHDPGFLALDTGEPEPPLVAMVRDESGRVAGLRFDRLVSLVRNDRLDPWA